MHRTFKSVYCDTRMCTNTSDANLLYRMHTIFNQHSTGPYTCRVNETTLVSISSLQCFHCAKISKSTACPDCVFTTIPGPALYYWSEVSVELSLGFKSVLAPHMERLRRTGLNLGVGRRDCQSPLSLLLAALHMLLK